MHKNGLYCERAPGTAAALQVRHTRLFMHAPIPTNRSPVPTNSWLFGGRGASLLFPTIVIGCPQETKTGCKPLLPDTTPISSPTSTAATGHSEDTGSGDQCPADWLGLVRSSTHTAPPNDGDTSATTKWTQVQSTNPGFHYTTNDHNPCLHMHSHSTTEKCSPTIH